MNDEHVIKEEEHRGLRILIYNDLEPDSPREWENLGHMICFHRKYNLGDKHDFTIDSFREFIGYRLQADPIISLPLYLYDHSGISISTRSFIGRAHHAEWDSGMVGYIYVTKEEVRKEFGVKRISPKLRAHVIEILEGEVKTYDQYLTGDVYGYVIEGAAGEHLDSCWGFYGFDYCLTEAKSEADYWAEKFASEAAEIRLAEIGG